LSFHKLQPVDVEDSTEVLAWFDHGQPAITEHRLEQGRVVWFLASADASWGNWTTSPLYLPLVQQMAADLLNLTGEGPIRFRSIGDDQLPRRGLPASVTTVAMKTDSADSKLGGGRRIFGQPGFDRRDDALYVVNGLAKESDPTRMEPVALTQHFGLTQAGEGNTVASDSVIGEKRNELWPWLAAAIFVLLVTEFALANRTSA
jgi:hypothetical protein